MKKILTNWKIIGILLAALLITTITFVVVYKYRNNGKTVVEGPHQEEVAGNTEVIFSFDSYKEIIGTKPSLVNDFGATVINKDDTYITEGEGSWLIKPQGDYELKKQYPYLRMKCYDSTFITNNFEGYDQLLLDVYNASEDDVDIKWRFRSKTKDGQQNIDTEEMTYTLKAGEWTTCEYDLVSALYAVQYDLSDMQYMTIKILSQKETKEDTVAQLYFDNLRGHLMEGEREEVELTGDFEKVISFEDSADRAYFRNNNSWIPNNNILSRVAYKDTTIKSMDFMGEYVLRGDATASTFPGTTITFDKTYAKGKYLSFMMYIEVDKDLVEQKNFKTWAVQCPGHLVTRAGGVFNKWIQIDIQLLEDCNSLWFFPQFGWDQNLSIFGQNPVTIYMDHFVIADEVKDLVVYNFDFEKGITFEKEEEENAIVGSSGSNEGKYAGQWSQSVIALERTKFDGSYTMMGKTNSQFPEIFVPFNKTYQKGSTFTFRYYVEGTAAEDETFIVTMRGYPAGEKEMTTYTVNARKFNRWYETTFTFTEAHDRVSIFIELANTSAIKDGKTVNIYYDDFYINKQNASSIKKFDFEKGVTFEIEEQEEAMVGSSGDNTPRFVGQWSQSILTLKRKLFDGSYTMAGQTNCQYPEAFVELGKTYPAGTNFTFRYYVEGEPADGETYAVSMRGYTEGTNITPYTVSSRKMNRWYETTFTFAEAHDRVSIFMELGITGALKDGKTVTIYYDDLYINKQNASSIKKFDFEKGVTFEIEEQEEAMVGSSGDNTPRFVGQWSQSILTLKRKLFDGSYTMAGQTNCQYPEAFVELGKTYPAGTNFTFRYYVEGEPADGETYAVSMRGYTEGTNNFTPYTVSSRKMNRWYETTFTFAEAHDRVSIFMELGITGALKDGKTVTIYYDDLYINKQNASSVKVFDFEKGVTFEIEEQEEAMVGSSGDDTPRFNGQWSQSILSPLTRAEFGGSYTMMGKTNCQYPEAFVELGKTYPAGTTFTFRYYVKGEVGLTETHKVSVVGYSAGDNTKTTYEITGNKFNKWNELTITFAEAHDRLALRVELAGTSAIADGKQAEIYFDDLYINKEIDESEVYVPDFEAGIDFEDEEQENVMVGSTGENTNRFNGQWSQTILSLSRAEFDGSYTMKGITNCQFPEAFIEFGNMYPAGTTFTFRYYAKGNVEDTETHKVVAVGYPGGENATITYEMSGKKFNQWNEITVTFQEPHDRIALRVELAGTGAIALGKKAELYFDDLYINTVAEQPEVYVPDFEKGVNFENMADLGVIAPYNGSNGFSGLWSGNWANASLQTFNNSTQLAITGTNSTAQWPTFYVNFGKTYPAGTVLTFNCYYDSTGNSEGKLFEMVSGQSEPVNTHTISWIGSKTVTRLTFTLKNACDRIAIQTTVHAGSTMYYDDFKVVTQIDFEEGVDFESAATLGLITPYNGSNGFSGLWSGNLTNVSLQTFNNSTQLAITGTNSNAQWPTFYVNFGKTYPAGTVLTFNCYYDSTGNSEGTLYEMVSGQSEPVKAHTISWIGSKTVTELSFTLENACDRIAIFTTVHAGSTMYYDDFKIQVPSN